MSFLLPERGPSGDFPSGSRTEIAATGPDGTTSVFGMRWNKMEGTVTIRIVASQGARRATAICTVTLASSAIARDAADAARSARGGHKWVLVTLAIAAAAGGGLATTGLAQKSAAAAPSPAPRPPLIGLPSITLERP